MSLQEAKKHLIQLLADEENKVIAVSGKWGTGKSHLWREVRDASADPKINGALYVSLFGLRDMGQIKLKIVQSALPHAKEESASWDSVTKVLRSGRTFLQAFHKGFSALDDLALLAVPFILKDKLIVLDDIERKHDELSIDEILGFIDEFTQQHRARFLLVLNSDQLARREMWDTLREKVVDQEIHLNTSAVEAFTIASGLTSSQYAQRIGKSVETCNITNIRIIRKIIKTVNRILGDRTNLADAVLARVIPSVVLLAAINYNGIEDGPDFQYVLSIGSPNNWLAHYEKKEEDGSENSKRRGRWNLIINELGILGCDEFEVLMVEFLESGLFDTSKIYKIIDRYVAETNAMEAREEAHQFLMRSFWDYRLEETVLLEQARKLISVAHLLDPFIVTDLDIAAAKLPDGNSVGQAIIDAWIYSFRTRGLEEVSDENPFNRPLHNAIKAEFAKINARAQEKTTVFDACIYMANNSGWGTMQEVAMRSASTTDFEETIRTLTIDDLRLFMRKMLDLLTQRQTYDQHFGSATDHFKEVCRNIVLDPTSARLGRLIRRLFEDAKLGDPTDLPQK